MWMMNNFRWTTRFLEHHPVALVNQEKVTHPAVQFRDPMDCSIPGFPVHHQLLELLKLMSIESVMLSNHLILCRPLLLLLSVFQNQGLFQ